MAAFDHMRRNFEHGNFEDLSFTISRVTRALTTGAYRRRSIPLDRDTTDDDEHNDEAMLSPEARAMARPYFEVLIVDNVNDHQERWLKSNVARMRRPEDPFHYEAVVVPSLEDALIAVLFNHNIQAIVVRPGLVLKSKNDNEILSKYVTNASDSDAIDAMLPEDYGPELCRLIARVRPELDAYLVTERSVEDIAGLDLGICRRVFYNQEDFMELHLNILRGVAARNKTPFFTALVEYSKQPTGVFHAMPISRGKSITRSHWIQDMGAFYGPNIFLAETSPRPAGSTACWSRKARSKRRKSWPAAPLDRNRPSLPPTAPRHVTRSLCRPWSGPVISCWWTGTATNRTTTAWFWPGPKLSTSTAIH